MLDHLFSFEQLFGKILGVVPRVERWIDGWPIGWHYRGIRTGRQVTGWSSAPRKTHGAHGNNRGLVCSSTSVQSLSTSVAKSMQLPCASTQIASQSNHIRLIKIIAGDITSHQCLLEREMVESLLLLFYG
eukprot:scpid92903/ scgid31178/ 